MSNVVINRPAERGFTLVELAIVLVIIGLILGGVLGGQTIMNNARINSMDSATKAYNAAVLSYAGTYGVLPGDDTSAATRFPASPLGAANVNSTTGTNAGNGLVDGTGGTTPFIAPAATIPTGTETLMAWHHLRAAGLIENKTPSWGQPAGPFNGSVWGIQNNALGMTGNLSICLSAVPQAQASQFDQKFDDGAPSSGNIRAVSATGGRPTNNMTTASALTDYSTAGTYAVCRLLP